MGKIVSGPEPHRVPVTGPFERVPQCGCDTGTGMTFREQAIRIAELEAALLSAADQIERVYGNLPRDGYPGPPITILENMSRAAKGGIKDRLED